MTALVIHNKRKFYQRFAWYISLIFIITLSGCASSGEKSPGEQSSTTNTLNNAILVMPPAINKAKQSLQDSQSKLGLIKKDCSSGSSPRATPEMFSSAEGSITLALDAIYGYFGVNEETGELTTADESALLDQADNAVSEARSLAKQCGADEPDFPDGANWSKTWWDFSSP